MSGLTLFDGCKVLIANDFSRKLFKINKLCYEWQKPRMTGALYRYIQYSCRKQTNRQMDITDFIGDDGILGLTGFY